jgi:hypothetical protein
MFLEDRSGALAPDGDGWTLALEGDFVIKNHFETSSIKYNIPIQSLIVYSA